MKKDTAEREHIDELRSHLRAYHETEQDLITTSPTLAEINVENYSDSCKWLRLPIVGEEPETVSSMILLGVEDFPNDCLTGILVQVLKNQVPTGVHLSGISSDRVGNSVRFCISGSTSLEELQTLFERFSTHQDFGGEK